MRRTLFLFALALTFFAPPAITRGAYFVLGGEDGSSAQESLNALVNTPKTYKVTGFDLSDPVPNTWTRYVVVTARSRQRIPNATYISSAQDICLGLAGPYDSGLDLVANNPAAAILTPTSDSATFTTTFTQAGDYFIYNLVISFTNNDTSTSNLTDPSVWSQGCIRTNPDPNDASRPYIVGFGGDRAVVSFNTTNESTELIALSAATVEGQPIAVNQTVTPGQRIGAHAVASQLQIGRYGYRIVFGKIEGAYRGPKQTCLDIQNHVNLDDYGSSALSADYIADFATTEKSYDIGATFNPENKPQRTQFRLVAFMFRNDQEATPTDTAYCDEIDTSGGWWRMAAKGFNGATDEEDGSDDGAGGARPQPVNFVPAATAGGIGGTTAQVGIDALNTADMLANPADAFCKALTIRLPGSGGIIDAGKAGILGVCNTRPLLVNMINILLILAGIFFVGAVIYSGIMLVEASSDEVAMKAKKNLGWAAIGAIIVILSNWIVPFIIGVISTTLTTTTPDPVVYLLEQQDLTRHI